MATYVVEPTVIKRLAGDYEFFKSKGVIIRPKILRGTFLKYPFLEHKRLWRLRRLFRREYPKDYTEKEKKIILKYIQMANKDRDKKFDKDWEKEGGRYFESDIY